MATVGSGKYTYEVIEDWARLPDHITFSNVSAVATDSQDRVYVFQRKPIPPVVIFDREGNGSSVRGATGTLREPPRHIHRRRHRLPHRPGGQHGA